MADLGREAAEEGVPDVTERERKVLVEEILKELAHAEVGPATVDEQQPLEVRKPSQSKVACEDGLLTFLTTDTYTNVGGWTQTDTVTHIDSIVISLSVCLSVCPLITFLTTDTYANVGGWTQTDIVTHTDSIAISLSVCQSVCPFEYLRNH